MSRPSTSFGLDTALPPEDRQLSPFTGWTREHWESCADSLLAAAARHATRSQALVHFPGGRGSMSGPLSDGLEGYARTFLLAAFRLASAAGAAPGDIAARYADGLVAGTSRDGTDAWPAIVDLSQPMVEAASIAIGLFETRPWIWDQLTDGQREHVVGWLSGVHGKQFWPTNWLLFQVMVNCFLKSVGALYRQEEIDRNLDQIDSMYRRDGWYTDGAGRNYDHYIGWAIHLYTWLWCRMDGDRSDPPRAAEYRRRIRRFLEDFACLFAADGAPLHQGRSLIYRFAAAAPLWIGALADASPLAIGETRRIASGCVRHFLERGALRDGCLTMGWHREFLPMAQFYSGPASPYWASKAFIGLLLPADHPEWTAIEQPMAVERSDFVRAIAEPGWLAQGTKADGIVRIANHGSDHFPFLGPTAADANYRKLAYSTHTGPELGDGDVADNDNHVALLGDGAPSTRARIHPIAAADCFAASVYFPGELTVAGDRSFPLWQERVETVSIGHAGAEIRVHHVTSPWPRRVRDGGFAVADDEAVATETGPGWARASRRDGLTSCITGLHGFSAATVESLDGTNPFGKASATPLLLSDKQAAAEAVYVSVVTLSMAAPGVLPAGPRFEIVSSSRRAVKLRCSDGTHFYVQLVAVDEIDEELGGRRLSGSIRFARVAPAGDVFAL